MEIAISALGLLFLAALTFAVQAVKRRSDVLYGPYIERGFSKRLATIAVALDSIMIIDQPCSVEPHLLFG